MKRSDIPLVASIAGVALLIGVPSGAREATASEGSEKVRRLMYNLDDGALFTGQVKKHLAPDLGASVPRMMDAFVDFLSQTGVTDFFICVNSQRTTYDSEAWESAWEGYDPAAGDDQPFFAGIDPKRAFEREWVKQFRSLHEQGIDYCDRFISRARAKGLSPWISLRMNDSHYSDRPTHPYHRTFWKQHPEWRLSDAALDYERPEVRRLYMALVKEVCQRYDMHGLELDFLRFTEYFRPGREHEGAKLMTAFVREARRATQEASARRGHKIELAVRVPTRPWIARRKGLDAVAWAKEGLVDLIIVAPWFISTQSDVPVETWKGLLIDRPVRIAVCLESGITSGPGKRRTIGVEQARGVAISALHRGADAIYLFNLFGSPQTRWGEETHNEFLAEAGTYEILAARPRRHPLTVVEPWAEGEPGERKPLPFEGVRGVFRIHIGPKPSPGQSTHIELEQAAGEKPRVSLNDVVCTWARSEGHLRVYDVPEDAVSDGYNLVTLEANKAVKINWIEIAVQKAKATAAGARNESGKLKITVGTEVRIPWKGRYGVFAAHKNNSRKGLGLFKEEIITQPHTTSM